MSISSIRTESSALLSVLLLAASAVAYGYGPAGNYGYGTYPRSTAPTGYGYHYPQADNKTGGAAKETTDANKDTSAGSPVAIKSMSFEPAIITIKPGEAVTWTHQDAAPHVVQISTGEFSSGTLQRGQSYTKTLENPGTYEYFCALHPSMRGTIVVR